MTATTLAPSPPAQDEQAAGGDPYAAGPDAHMAEIAPRPLGGHSVDHPRVENFIWWHDVEHECEHGYVPAEVFRKEGARCSCHDKHLSPREPEQAKEPTTPDLLEVLKPDPKRPTPVPTKEEPVTTTTPPPAAPGRPADLEAPIPVQPCDGPDLAELPPFLAGLVREIDDEVARLTAARDRLVEAARG